MFRPVIRPDCCRNYQIPCNTFKCFKNSLYAELKRLHLRHSKAFCKSSRIRGLAVPKDMISIHIPKCPCPFAKTAQMVYPDEHHTRTEQLALPSVRRLLLFKETFKKLIPQRKAFINRLIRSSLFSLYSRLSRVDPPERRIPIRKWDNAEWKKHTRYFRRLALPKKLLSSPPPNNPRMPLSEMSRFKKLALPHTRMTRDNPEWVFTPAMNNYKPSERLRKIALPSRGITPKWVHNADVSLVNPDTFKYKATERIKKLAKPAEKRLAASELKENPFTISPNALKYKASKRIKEMAEPREYGNKHIRDNPFGISKKALTAKTTPRLSKLAQPKNRREKFKSPEKGRRGF